MPKFYCKFVTYVVYLYNQLLYAFRDKKTEPTDYLEISLAFFRKK